MKDLDYTPNIHARGLKNTRSHRFVAIIPEPSQDNGYWALVTEGIMKGSRELSSFGAELTLYHYDRFSFETLQKRLEQIVEQSFEGLLIAPTFHDEVQRFLSDHDIPVMFIDSDIEGIKTKISYMGQDSYKSGVLSAKLMSLLIRGIEIPKILIVHPPGENIHHQERIKGFSEYLSSARQSVVITELSVSNDSLIVDYSPLDQFDGIFVANSYVYEIAEQLTAGLLGAEKVALIGYDLIPSGKESINDGRIDFIITQEPQAQGYQGILTLYNSIVLSREVEETIHTPLTIITKENLEEYIY